MSPVRALGAVLVGAAVSLAVLLVVLGGAAFLFEDEGDPFVWPVLAVTSLVLTPPLLAYHAAGAFVVARSVRARPWLGVCAVFFGLMGGPWIAVSGMAESVLQIAVTAVGSAVAISMSLWLGSEALQRTGVRERRPG